MKNTAAIAIVGKPGRLRDGLLAALAAMPGIEIVSTLDDGGAILGVIGTRPVDLVILDGGPSGDDLETTMRRIKAASPPTRCLVLAGTRRQQDGAASAGADDVLLRGFPIGALYAAIDRLLAPGGL